MKSPRTLQEAIVYFGDPDRAFEYACKMRWPDGKVSCPRCNSAANYFIKTRKLWLCRGCNKQFTLKVNTIFEDSPLGLDKWMAGFWMLVNCKNGVSSMEIHRALGITQKAAWFMLQRGCTGISPRNFFDSRKIGGEGCEMEVDETFVGGLTKNMHKGKRAVLESKGPYKNKTIVQGILDRNLREVRAAVVPNVSRRDIAERNSQEREVRQHGLHRQPGRL